jgi:hypothetical protein
MHLIDDRSQELDAEYSVEAEGDRLALIMESRSGRAKGQPGRNPDYNLVLTILLTRLGRLNAVLVDALVDSRWTQRRGLPEADRRLIQSPIQLPRDEPSAKALRIKLAEAQARIADNPETSKAGGTKRIRLRVDVPGYRFEDATRLAEILAPPIAERTGEGMSTREHPMHSQGFQLDQEAKVIIETYAMNAATEFYSEHGWVVEDVHGSESYDLICRRRNEEKHVEVKGTTMLGTEVILTDKEVKHARDYRSTALFVVAEIAITRDNGGLITAANGGIRHVYDPWRIEDGVLTPINYRYQVPGARV